MAVPSSVNDFLDVCRKSGVVEENSLSAITGSAATTPVSAAKALVRAGALTKFQAAQLLAGKYRGLRFDRLKILDKIGAGGMGTVFLCEHLGLRKKVAVKVLPPDQAGDEGTRERFFREARAAAALDHPNIVRVHDMASSGGVHYIVMEYVEGQDLQSVLNKYGAMPYGRACTYIAQAALGLQHAHEKGLVHRDIKPANLLVDKDGVVKILDLGLATFNSESAEKDNLTARFDKGAVLGTADFMAPEQVLESSNVDIRADIYSLGATLYTLVNGKPPFSGSCTQKLVGHTTIKPASLTEIRREIPKGLSTVVDKMMAKDPAQRFQTPAEVVEALNPWLEADTIPLDGQQTRKMPGTAKSGRRKAVGKKSKLPIIVAAVAGSALVFGGLGAWALSGGSDSTSGSDKVAAAAGPANPPRQTAQPKTNAATPNPPTARPGAQLVYELDFAKGSGFLAKYENKQRISMDGAYPSGWTSQSWRAGATAQVGVQDHAGSRGAAMITTRGDGASAELQTMFGAGPYTFIPGRHYLLRTEFANVGTHPANLEVRFDAERPPVKTVVQLKPSRGEWQTADLRFTAPPHQTATTYFTHPGGLFPDYLVIRSVQLYEFGDTPAAPSGPRNVIYRTDIPSLTPVRIRKLGKDTQEETGPVPDGYETYAWNKETVMEFAVEADGASKVLALRNLEGRHSVMAFLHNVPGKAGGTYDVTVEYQSDAAPAGKLRVLPGGGTVRDVCELPATGAEWKTLKTSYTLGAGEGAPVRLELHGYGTGREQPLRVRSVAVVGEGPPVAAAGGQLVFEEDFSRLPAFRGTMTNPGGLKMQEGRLPEGWNTFVWKKGASGEIGQEDFAGKKGVALRTTEGDASAELTTVSGRTPKTMVKAGHRYRVEVEYASPGGPGGRIDVRMDDLAKPGTDQAKLAATGQGWKTAALEFAVPADKDRGFSLYLSNYGVGTQNTLYVRTVRLFDLAATGGPALYRLLAADLKPFKLPLSDGRHATTNNTPDLPPGVIVGMWRKEDAGEVAVEDVAGRRALSLANADGGVSVQVFPGEPVAQLKLGQEYVLRVVHWGGPACGGRVQLRQPGTTESFVKHPCEGTDGKWVETTTKFTATFDGPAFLYIQNGAGGADAKFAVQGVELFAGAAPVAAAPPLVAAPPVVAAPTGYRLDLTNARPFARRYKKDQIVESQGEGTLPAGWSAHTILAETVGDVFVDPIGGTPALGLRNHEGPASVELFAKAGLLAARAGKKYAVRVTYQTEANGKGGCQVFVGGEEAGGTAFAPSVGAWKDVELTVAATVDGPLTMNLTCGSGGSDSSVFVKAIEIKEAP
jgi:serine/threonine protein kinase